MQTADTVAWDSWPLRDEPPAKSALLIAIIGGTSLLASAMGALWGYLAAPLLGILMGPYLLRTRYRISPQGVAKRFPLFSRQRPWSAYLRYAIQRDGVFLGTFPHPSRLDSFRGEFLRFSADVDRELIIAIVRRQMDPAEADDPTPPTLPPTPPAQAAAGGEA